MDTNLPYQPIHQAFFGGEIEMYPHQQHLPFVSLLPVLLCAIIFTKPFFQCSFIMAPNLVGHPVTELQSLCGLHSAAAFPPLQAAPEFSPQEIEV